jgi:DNA-binding response OmpR family regulator
VLVIDQAIDRSSISTVLEALRPEHYVVMRVRMGTGVVDEVVQLSPSLVLVDHESVGRPVARLCRDLHERVASRVVVIAHPRASDAEVVEMLDAGADDVVSGAARTEVVLARLRAATRSQLRVTPRRCIALGDVQLDLDAHAVRVGGELLKLAPLQFDLFAYLAERPGTIVTTDDLMVRLWGADRSELSTRRLRIAVSWLRKALGQGPLRPKVETVHRVGYRLDVVATEHHGEATVA